MPKSSPPIAKAVSPKAAGAAFVVAALSLYASLNYFQALQAYSNKNPFQDAAQARFAPVAAVVPPGAVLQYRTDLRSGIVAPMAIGAAQYALAPRVLESGGRGGNLEWVLGDFYNPVDVNAFARQNGLKVERDMGTGVVLFRRIRP